MTARSSRLVVAAAVVDSLVRPTAMLCAARSYPAEHAGQYELPGGKVEPGETPTRALIRELAEELDLVVTLGDEVRPPHDLAVAAPPPGTAPRAQDFPDDDAPAWPVLHGYRMRVWLPRGAGRPGQSSASRRRARVGAMGRMGGARFAALAAGRPAHSGGDPRRSHCGIMKSTSFMTVIAIPSPRRLG